MRRWKGGCIAGTSWLRIVGVGDRPVPVFLLFESRTKSPTVKDMMCSRGEALCSPAWTMAKMRRQPATATMFPKWMLSSGRFNRGGLAKDHSMHQARWPGGGRLSFPFVLAVRSF